MIKNIIDIVFYIVITCIFFISTYHKGLFHDSDFYLWEIIIQSIFVIYLCLKVFYYKEKLNLVSIFLFFFPIMYYVSFINAVTPLENWHEIFRWNTYACFFAFIVMLNKNDTIKLINPYIIYTYICCTVLFGFFSLWNIVDFQDAYIWGRMASFYQYPNTFGAVAAAGFIFGLCLLTGLQKSKKEIVIYSLPTVMLFTAVLLSESRAVYALLFIVWLALFIYSSIAKKIQLLLYTVVSVVLSLWLYTNVDVSADVKFTGLIEFVYTNIIFLVAVFLIKYLINWQNWSSSKKLRISLDSLSLLISFSLIYSLLSQKIIFNLLPKQLQERIGDINLSTYSVEGRLMTYKQVPDMVKDAPFFGYGGDSWSILFTTYQELPYWTTKLHSSILNMILEIGLLGLGIILILFVAVLIKFFLTVKKIPLDSKDRNIIIASTFSLLMLLLHSIIDFDFAFGSFVILSIFFMGMILGGIKGVFLPNYLNKVLIIGLVMLCCLTVYFNYQFSSSYNLIHNSGELDSLAQVERNFVHAIEKNPWNTSYKVKLAKIYFETFQSNGNNKFKERAYQLLDNAYEREENNPELLYDISELYSKFDDQRKAVKYLEKAVEIDQYSSKYKFGLMAESLTLAEKLLIKNNEEAKKHLKFVTNVYQAQKKVTNKFHNKSIPDRRKLTIKDEGELLAAESYFLLGKYSVSEKILNQKLNLSNKLRIRKFAILYLIAEQKNQKNISNKIINSTSDESYFNYIVNYLRKIRWEE